MSDQKGKDSIKNKLNGNGLYWLSQIVSKSCTLQITHQDRIHSAVDAQRPLIITGWHGLTMIAAPLIQEHFGDMSKFVVLMPDDWRGVALRIWTEKMTATPFPMNLKGDSTLGMARQVLRLTRQIEGGKHLYINPDGPDGPAQVIKPGIIFIARKANAVIVPVGGYARHAYVVPRWDRYIIPYPFSRISVHIGEPIEELPDDDQAADKLLTDTLNNVYLQAAADYYEKG